MFKKLYHWTLHWSAHRHAERALFGISFIESSVFPIPPDILLIPMCLANRARAIRYATICTIASVLGGLLGYAIGLFLFETIGQWVLQFYGLTDAFAGFELKFQQWGWWLVLMAGFTPFPYKVITIASGVFHLNIPIFIAASIISRGGRFFIEAVLLYHYGEKIRRFIDRYFGLLTILFFVLLLGGFAAIKLWV